MIHMTREEADNLFIMLRQEVKNSPLDQELIDHVKASIGLDVMLVNILEVHHLGALLSKRVMLAIKQGAHTTDPFFIQKAADLALFMMELGEQK